MATHLLPKTENSVGIALYHASEQQHQLMTELTQCLKKEDHFKKVTSDMIVPHLHINPFHLRASYMSWAIAMGVIMIAMLLIGFVVEVVHRRYYNKKERMRKCTEESIVLHSKL